jgi:hypothetical protein
MEFETRSMTNRGFKNHFHLEDENIMNLVDLEDEILKSKVTDVEATAGILQGKVTTPRFRALFAKHRRKPSDRKVYKRQC